MSQLKELQHYEPMLSQLMLLMAKETSFSCKPGLREILSGHERMVVAISHGSPLSWLPAISLLAAHLCARGGGRRRPIGVMDRVFFELPGTRAIARYFTQCDRPLALPEIVDCLRSGSCHDLVVFPEGSNCFFGDPGVIQDFRSPKFVEIAIRAGAPILICAHRGSERWAKAVPVGEGALEYLDFLPKFAFDFLERRLRKTGLFTLPLPPLPMARFALSCELYVPTIGESDLSEDSVVRHEQIRAEAEAIRARMVRLSEDLERREGAREFPHAASARWEIASDTSQDIVGVANVFGEPGQAAAFRAPPSEPSSNA